MAELSKHVPIIPVIMKADTMTIHEAQRFRQEVVNRLQNPSERTHINTVSIRSIT
jgi:septin 7